jgi:hypothetical protein
LASGATPTCTCGGVGAAIIRPRWAADVTAAVARRRANVAIHLPEGAEAFRQRHSVRRGTTRCQPPSTAGADESVPHATAT